MRRWGGDEVAFGNEDENADGTGMGVDERPGLGLGFEEG